MQEGGGCQSEPSPSLIGAIDACVKPGWLMRARMAVDLPPPTL
jgi:hypothetical protein